MNDPAGPVCWVRRDKYGFKNDDRYLSEEVEFGQYYGPILEQRRKDWVTIFKKNPELKPTAQLKKLVRLGIPAEYRGKVWQTTCGARKKFDEFQGYYQAMLRQNSNAVTEATIQIDKDVARTFPGHPIYDTKENMDRLRRVLVCYSFRNPSVGYCQSMNYIVAMLMLFMSEEEAFWMLATIVEDLLPLEFYTQSMLSSQVDQRVLSALLREKCPTVAKHLHACSIELPLVTSQWFLTLYINALPSESVLRVWDAFFLEGMKILFRVALGLIKMNESRLMSAEDFASVFNILREAPGRAVDCEFLMSFAFESIGGFPRRRIEQLRAHYYPQVRKEIAEMQEMRRQMHEERVESDKKWRETHDSSGEEDNNNKSNAVDIPTSPSNNKHRRNQSFANNNNTSTPGTPTAEGNYESESDDAVDDA